MKKSKEVVKTYFETGDKPTQEQYANLIDSYIDAKQSTGEPNRRFVIDENGEVSLGLENALPEYNLSDIVANKLSLLKDGNVVKEIDLTNYVDDTNLARLVYGALDVNGVATFQRDDNSTFTVDFSSLLNSGGVSTPTDLSFKGSLAQGTIESSTGKNAVIPVADKDRAGLMKAGFYDEGNWTPVISESSYSGTGFGTYLRLGNLVHYQMFYTIDSTTGTPGYFNISGLPFPPANSATLTNNNTLEIHGTNLPPKEVRDLTIWISSRNDLNRIEIGAFDVQTGITNFISGVIFTEGGIRIVGTYVTNVYTP